MTDVCILHNIKIHPLIDECHTFFCLNPYNKSQCLTNYKNNNIFDDIPHIFSDIQDGVFLVPKIALVATHYPGKQLIDDDGDSGQLDAMYDEVHETGGKIIRTGRLPMNNVLMTNG